MEIKAEKDTKKLEITKTTGKDFAAKALERNCSNNFIRLIISATIQTVAATAFAAENHRPVTIYQGVIK